MVLQWSSMITTRATQQLSNRSCNHLSGNLTSLKSLPLIARYLTSMVIRMVLRKMGITDELAPIIPISSVQINTSADRILTIGKGTDADSFVGTIDEVRIYDRGLSSNEVSIPISAKKFRHRPNPPIVNF